MNLNYYPNLIILHKALYPLKHESIVSVFEAVDIVHFDHSSHASVCLLTCMGITQANLSCYFFSVPESLLQDIGLTFTIVLLPSSEGPFSVSKFVLMLKLS